MMRHIQIEIDTLKERVLHMGSLAEEMIQLSVKSFLERQDEWHQKVFDYEEQVNQLQIDIDELGVKILALYQPEASDLRIILASMRINSELERIADQSINMIQTAYYHLSKEVPLKSYLEIPKMAAIAQEMVKGCLDSFSKKDVALAEEVLKKDQEIDTLKAKAMNEIIGLIPNRLNQTKQLVDLILIAKNLEKIGDHATNIAEDVIYMVVAQDVRHHTQRQDPPS